MTIPTIARTFGPLTALVTWTVFLAAPAPLAAQSAEGGRLVEAAVVFEEIMDAPDHAIPDWVLEGAAAVAVFPSTIKGGFIFGAHRGKGILSARQTDSDWSAPAFLTLTGASFGAQIGGQAIDLILVIMNERGLDQLLSNQFKLGVDASVAAGPLGRDAEASTDLQMRAQILSYSRTRGLFAGVTLKGSSIRQDRDANEHFYGEAYGTREVIDAGAVLTAAVPNAFARWQTTLRRVVP